MGMTDGAGDNREHESFEEFKNSFSYGSRSDLNFKYLKALSSQDAGRFFQDLLYKLGDAFDDGHFERIVNHVYEWQVSAYLAGGKWAYDTGPFTRPQKPISKSRLVLITSSEHFVDGDDPAPFGVKHMSQQEAIERINEFLGAAPALSAIPVDTPRERLRVRHGGYDIRGAQADPNVALPIELLRELEKKGVIGELTAVAYSFVGACSQTALVRRSGPKWAKMLQEQQVDAALLVPA